MYYLFEDCFVDDIKFDHTYIDQNQITMFSERVNAIYKDDSDDINVLNHYIIRLSNSSIINIYSAKYILLDDIDAVNGYIK